MNPNNAPAIVVPMDEAMATEPAQTIGQKFSDATFVKALVGAGFTIVGVVAPHLVPRLDDSLANAISTMVVLLASVIVAQQAKAVPKQQAAQTRDAVYAPSTVADLVQAEQPGSPVDAVVIPSPAPKASYTMNVRDRPGHQSVENLPGTQGRVPKRAGKTVAR